MKGIFFSTPLAILYLFKRSEKEKLSLQEIIDLTQKIFPVDKGEIASAIVYLVENRFIERESSNELEFKISSRGIQIANLFEKILDLKSLSIN